MQGTNFISQNGIEYKIFLPPPQLADFVEGIWMLKNTADTAHHIVVMPNGRFDIIFVSAPGQPHKIMQMGLETKPEKNSIPPQSVLFIISFKLLAIEYLLATNTASLLNSATHLPDDFWGITSADLNNFDHFCTRVSAKMISLIKPDIDSRKQQLFNLLYASKGALSVKELSEKVFWSSRQINRYFNAHFGISLKAYSSILRFTESLPHIKTGKLYPQLNYTDQNLFIKEVKRLSGVVPKELFKNQNDRFLLFHPEPKK